MSTRVCARCGEDKSREAFRSRPRNGGKGLEPYCRPCAREYQKEYRDANRAQVRVAQAARRAAERDEIHSYQRAWTRRNPQKMRAYRLRAKYGISIEDYDRMLVEQCGTCAACGDQMTDPRVDHCHATGRVRALLCHPCNTSLGFLREDPERIAGLMRYALEVC